MVAVSRLIVGVSSVLWLAAATVSCTGFAIDGGALAVGTLGGAMLAGSMLVLPGDSSCELSSGGLSAYRQSHG